MHVASFLLLLGLPALPCTEQEKSPSRPHPAVIALAYSPDGKWLAAAGRGEALLLDAANGDPVMKLPGQGPKVTALAFSSDSKFLAVASGTPGRRGEVRLYTVNEGDKPCFVLAAHQDLIHAIAFSSDKKLLATCSYDRLVKLWDVASGKLVRELKDHSDAVYGIAFHPQGKLLASCAADRSVKVWEVATGKRLYSLGEATDWLYSVAWSPDGTRLTAAGVDKSIRVWEAGTQQGRLVQSVFAHEGPVLQLAYHPDGSTLYSVGEDQVVKAWHTPRLSERQVYRAQVETVLAFALHPTQPQIAMGRFDGKLILVDAPTGKTVAEPLPSRFPLKTEQEPNDIPSQAQTISWPLTLTGTFDKAGDIDYFRFQARQHEAMGVHILPAPGSIVTPEVELLNPHGQVVAAAQRGALGHDCIPGWYIIKVRDREYKGGKNTAYRLKLGAIPVVTKLSHLGLQRGTKRTVQVSGVYLSKTQTWGLTHQSLPVEVVAPLDAKIGSRLPLPLETPWGPPVNLPSLVVGEYPDAVVNLRMMTQPQNGKVAWWLVNSVQLPTTVEGYVAGDANQEINPPLVFQARQGQPLVLEVEASRLGTPLDSVLEILDMEGRVLPRAILRSVGLTYSTFRDHDANGSGIRIESWHDLAINDYLYVGTQLLRIRALPKNPDDDCQFWNEGGRRKGYLGTTPSHVAQGMPMYKVEMHPPGTNLSPNGFPTFVLPWRNDDGGAGFGKDSYLLFDPPADGEYQVRVTDAQGRSGSVLAYRLTLRPPKPDYSIDFSPKAPAVWQGGGIPITVTAKRQDGFEGPIQIRMLNLPPGFEAPATTIPAGEESTVFTLHATNQASIPQGQANLRLEARASIHGQEVVREMQGKLPSLAGPGLIQTTVRQEEVILHPGEETRVTVTVERHSSFKGRIPVEVRGLPHGVRVLDIGLNGILITEKETVRTFVLYCEPWVQPQELPMAIVAKHEEKKTDHAARPVWLHVRPRR